MIDDDTAGWICLFVLVGVASVIAFLVFALIAWA